MLDLKQINCYFILSCLVGALLSYYAYTVEVKAEADHSYQAMCDISEHMSCTKAFLSKYGKGFGVVGEILGEDSILNQPNSFGGIFFYLILAILCFSEKKSIVRLQVCLSVISNLLSVYLASILYFVLYDFCIVCVTTYVINALNLGLSVLKWKRLERGVSASRNSGDTTHMKKH